MPLLFGAALGLAPMTFTATSTAAAAGGNYPALNVMIIVDTTASMNSNDPLCSTTKIACAEKGAQSILKQLNPSVDYIGMEVFPGVTSASAQYDVSNCSSHQVSPVEYGVAGFSGSTPTDTYTIVGLSTCTTGSTGNCYRTSSGATTLNTNSNLVKAVGSGSTSGCMKAIGGEGTFFADAITQAQSNLAAFKTSLGAAGANTQNVLIILSDGAANSSSSSNQIVAAESEQPMSRGHNGGGQRRDRGNLGILHRLRLETSAGCSTDKPHISPYCTMLELASNPSYFYSDAAPPSGACPNGAHGPAASANISNIFTTIGATLSSVRLIPNDTT